MWNSSMRRAIVRAKPPKSDENSPRSLQCHEIEMRREKHAPHFQKRVQNRIKGWIFSKLGRPKTLCDEIHTVFLCWPSVILMVLKILHRESRPTYFRRAARVCGPTSLMQVQKTCLSWCKGADGVKRIPHSENVFQWKHGENRSNFL